MPQETYNRFIAVCPRQWIKMKPEKLQSHGLGLKKSDIELYAESLFSYTANILEAEVEGQVCYSASLIVSSRSSEIEPDFHMFSFTQKDYGAMVDFISAPQRIFLPHEKEILILKGKWANHKDIQRLYGDWKKGLPLLD